MIECDYSRLIDDEPDCIAKGIGRAVLPRYFLHEESPLWPQIASEAFRDSTFGMIAVRILESGRCGQ